jgi:sirohydrochlorin cobaltochelatase
MRKKLLLTMAMLLVSLSMLQGCSSQTTETQKEVVSDKREDNVKLSKAILVASFGTSYNDSREVTIGAIEQAIQENYVDYEVRRAFTSQIVIDILKNRDNLEIDNIKQALDRAVEDRIDTLIVQPTHLMEGFEYTDLAKLIEEYKNKFANITLASPLLIEDSDYEGVAKAITEVTTSYDNGETAICFMGHGTEADSNAVYEKLQRVLTDSGYENYFVGTVEATPGVDDLLNMVNEAEKYKKVVLLPLMVVAGDHANNDMAGDEEESWKTIFTEAGYEVECVLEGLGQNEAIQDIYVDHVQKAMATLSK